MLVRILAILCLVVLGTPRDLGAQEPKAEPKKIGRPYKIAPDMPLESKEEVVAVADNHTQYRVEFNGVKGDRVPAYLYVPKSKDNKGPFPAILLQYGTGGNKKTNYIVEIGKQFVARGYVVITIDSPNQGERRKKKENKSADVLGLWSSEMMFHYCGDYSRAVDFLESRKEVKRDQIGYVGISWGAITGITYCAHDPRIKAVGSMVGGGNWLGVYTQKTAERVAKIGSDSTDPVYHVARIAPRPLLFINVTKDQLILKAWAESLHKFAGEGSKVVWLDTDHYFNGIDRAAACESVIDFMDERMLMKKQKGSTKDIKGTK